MPNYCHQTLLEIGIHFSHLESRVAAVAVAQMI